MKYILRTYLRIILVAVMLMTMTADAVASSSSAASWFTAYGGDRPGDATLPLGIRYTKRHPLIIVADWNYPPYSFRNDNGEPDGFLIEMIGSIFNQLHVPYEIRMMDLHEARRQLYRGEAQLMMQVGDSLSMRHEMLGKSVVVKFPVGVARLKSTPPIHSIEMLTPHDTICTNGNGYIYRYLEDYFRNSQRFGVVIVSSTAATQALLSGEVKYYVWSKVAMDSEIHRLSLQDKLIVDDIDIPDGQFRFTSNDKALLGELDEQFERLQRSGRYQPLVDKWLSLDGKYDKGITVIDIIVIVGMLLFVVGSIIAFVMIKRSDSSYNLKREYRAIAHMSIRLTDCNVFAINVRRQWVYNVSGDVLPRQGMSMADYEALIHPDDLAVERVVRQRVDGGQVNMPVVELRMRKYQGAPDDWRHMRINAFVKCNRRGKPTYVYLALHDDTERMREQATLAAQLREFSYVTEISEHGMIYYDANGKFVNCNRAMVRLVEKGGVMRGEEFMKSTTRDGLKALFNGLPLERGEQAWFCSLVDVPERNLHLQLEVRINPVTGDDGRYHGFSVSIQDLTDKLAMRHRDRAANRRAEHNERDLLRYRKEMEFALRERDTLNDKFQQMEQTLKEQTQRASSAIRQRSIFLANMTHELRTPLNLINGFAEVMQTGATAEEKEQYYAIMQHNCTMLINIIDNILRLSNIDTEGITIRAHRTDFARDFAEGAADMRKYIDSPRVDYHVETPLNTLAIDVDTEHVMIILDALVNNAAKNTREGSIRVGFTYDKSARQLTVYCQDTGCGIPADKQEEIFDCFAKVNPFVPGTGIGLYLCRRIADAMHARLEVESREGEGSTFTLTLPL